MKRPEDDKEFMEVVGHLISHPRFQKLDGAPVSLLSPSLAGPIPA